MKVKSLLAMLLALCVILTFAACGKSPAPVNTAAPTQQPETQPAYTDYTDDTGRTVKVPSHITRIAVTGPMSQIFVFALAPDYLVGISNAWDAGAEAYFDAKYFNLPVLGQLYGGKGELNLETLLAADPQIVLDIGESKEGAADDLTKLSEQTGIPFLHIDADSESFGQAFLKLGDLLGLEKAAKELSDYCDEVYALASNLGTELGENQKTILYLLGDNGQNVIARGSYHGEILDLVTENRAVLDNPSSKGTGNETDMEQLLLWDPDFIIFSYDSIGDTVSENPIWNQLTAIQNRCYAVAPYGPYNWMGFPPSVQRYLGILWMIQTIYPEQADFDLYTEVNRYFGLFYHCQLTQEQFGNIVG